jgi:hypothetical protein
MQREWNTIKAFTQDQFAVELAWCYEDLPLSHVFETAEDIALHQKRCEDYTDTHYVARVRVFYDGHEMGSDYLGSCYAYGCDPSVDIENGIGGYLEQMIETAMEEARAETVRMIARLKKDFPGCI